MSADDSSPTTTELTPAQAPWAMGPERNTAGHFAAGNQLARGNTGKRHEAMLRKAAREAATPEQARDLMVEAYRIAMDDTVNKRVRLAWAEFWASYALGKPVQALSIDDESEGGVISISLIRATPGGSSADS